MKTITSQDVITLTATTREAVRTGPVIVEEKDGIALVLMTLTEYEREDRGTHRITDLLALPGAEEIDFEPPLSQEFSRAAELD